MWTAFLSESPEEKPSPLHAMGETCSAYVDPSVNWCAMFVPRIRGREEGGETVPACSMRHQSMDEGHLIVGPSSRREAGDGLDRSGTSQSPRGGCLGSSSPDSGGRARWHHDWPTCGRGASGRKEDSRLTSRVGFTSARSRHSPLFSNSRPAVYSDKVCFRVRLRVCYLGPRNPVTRARQ